MPRYVKTAMHEGQNKIARYIRMDQLLRFPEGMTLKEIMDDEKMDHISKRLLQENLKEFENKYDAEFVQNLYRGRERLWRYKDIHFSIMKQALDDMEIIRNSIEKLSLFKGDPRYDILRFYLMGLEKGLSGDGLNFMSFDNNSEVTGMDHMEIILDAIINRYPLKMLYRTFSGSEFESNIHPYHLRQSNRRWYIFALSEKRKEIHNYPLDRIVHLEHLSKPYIPTDIDFDEYFDDIVGVSNYANREIERIVLKINCKSIDYIRTKPLHWTQTELKNLETDEYVFIQLKVKVNTELKMLLFSYNEAVEVLEPAWLRNDFLKIIQNMSNNYNV